MDLFFKASLLDGIDPSRAAVLGKSTIYQAKFIERAGDALIFLYPGNKYVKIGPGYCWRDGGETRYGSACPIGNCLESNGRAGMILSEQSVKCQWYCPKSFRKCKYQICC